MATFQAVSELIVDQVPNAFWTLPSHLAKEGISLFSNPAHDPLVTAIVFSLYFAIFCLVGSVFTGNVSFVDMGWSIVPVAYTAIFALHFNHQRTTLAFVLSLVWGARLTWNLWLKGGYSLSFEDYRWPWLRSIIPPIPFFVFNVTFISLYQNILLLLIVTPAYFAGRFRKDEVLGGIDFATAFLFLSSVSFETIADLQQRQFRKLRDSHKIRPVHQFITTGLFAYSRHPNFFAEMANWWFFYLISVSNIQTNPFNWTIVGTVLLTLLFQGSTIVTEHLSIAKYPSYREYQHLVSRFIPWFPADVDSHLRSHQVKTVAAPHHEISPPSSPVPTKKRAVTKVITPEPKSTITTTTTTTTVSKSTSRARSKSPSRSSSSKKQ